MKYILSRCAKNDTSEVKIFEIIREQNNADGFIDLIFNGASDYVYSIQRNNGVIYIGKFYEEIKKENQNKIDAEKFKKLKSIINN